MTIPYTSANKVLNEVLLPNYEQSYDLDAVAIKELSKYVEIQSAVNDGAIFDEDLRRLWTGFYQLRLGGKSGDGGVEGKRRIKSFWEVFTQYMAADWDAEVLLKKLKDATTRVELSFATKIQHTKDPSKAKWDDKALKNLNWSKPQSLSDAVSKITALNNLYSKILSSENWDEVSNHFDQTVATHFPGFVFHDAQKLDYLLWKIKA